MKSIIKKIVVMCILVYTAAVVFSADKKSNVKYVSAQTVEVKASDSAKSKTVKKITYGTPVTVNSEKGKWSSITLETKETGWIMTSALSSRKLTSKNITVNVKELALAGKGAAAGIEAAIDEAYEENFALVDKVESFAVSEEKILSFADEGKLKRGDE